MGLRLGSHSATELIYHFTFIPKYRKRRLVGRVRERLEGMIKFCAQVNDWEILELNVQPDHVHLLIQTKPEDSPADVMQLVKGGTSKKLREMFPNLIETIWTKSFWADGYYAGTVGQRSLTKVKDYVKNQYGANEFTNERKQRALAR